MSNTEQPAEKVANDSREIVDRFFEAITELKAMGRMKGIYSFAAEHGVNKGAMYNLVNNKDNAAAFQVAWIYYLARDYGVSIEWIMTGRGKMIK